MYRKITGFDSETHRFYAEPVATRELIYSNIKNNYNRLTHMSMEELAEFIVPLASCPHCYARKVNIEDCGYDCKKAWLDWLKQEHIE